LRQCGTLRIQGVPLDDGFIQTGEFHPLDAVTWLANELPLRGAMIRAGQWVSVGGFSAPRVVMHGQDASFRLDRMGEIALTLI
jgi:2-keto-4-pentenoate hydratase